MGKKSSVDFNPAFSSPLPLPFSSAQFYSIFYPVFGFGVTISFYSIPHKYYITVQGPLSHPVKHCLIIARAGLVNRHSIFSKSRSSSSFSLQRQMGCGCLQPPWWRNQDQNIFISIELILIVKKNPCLIADNERGRIHQKEVFR